MLQLLSGWRLLKKLLFVELQLIILLWCPIFNCSTILHYHCGPGFLLYQLLQHARHYLFFWSKNLQAQIYYVNLLIPLLNLFKLLVRFMVTIDYELFSSTLLPMSKLQCFKWCHRSIIISISVGYSLKHFVPIYFFPVQC